jgi:ADP-ribose pyrophosphatase
MSSHNPRPTERRQIHRGKVVDLAIERAELPNGEVCDLEVIRHQGAAAIVPLLGDEVVLVRQYRHATGGWLLEVPAGKLDGGEAPEDCARRELVEETGFRAGQLQPLGWIWTTPGFCDEKIWLFLATDLEPAEQNLEFDEVLSVERLALAEAVAMAINGEMTDGKSICALLRAAAHLK